MRKIINMYLSFYPVDGTSSLKKRIPIHIIFWIGMAIYNVMIDFDNQPIGFIYLKTTLFLLMVLFVFYGSVYYVFPKFIMNNKPYTGLFLLFFIYCICYFLHYIYYYAVLKYNYVAIGDNWEKYVRQYLDKGLAGLFTPINLLYELNLIFMVLGLPFLIKTCRVTTKHALKNENLQNEKSTLEIEFLRTNLSPDFLLNSLNNIYSKVIFKDKSAENAVLALADSLKFILYNSAEKSIDLSSEIEFIKNYIELETQKGNKNTTINFVQQGELTGHRIVPLILINYVESAFQFIRNADIKSTVINIGVHFKDEKLHFNINIDFQEIDKNNKLLQGDIMTSNAEKRLQLFYPEAHSLTITKGDKSLVTDIWIKVEKI
jgi:two-component system, LytTR family, sensor kinase